MFPFDPTIILALAFFCFGWKCLQRRFKGEERLDGKVVIVTGSNTGIGKQTALELARRGASVILACRNPTKALEAEQEIREETGNENVRFRELDLSSLDSVRNFVSVIKTEEGSIYALVNNAGVFWCPYKFTKDGFELNFGVNHLGHFLLTILLLPLLQASRTGARIITVSSLMCTFGQLDFSDLDRVKRGYNFVTAYSDSKLANVLFMWELSRRLGVSSGVTTYSVDPGIVYTDIGRESWVMGSWLFRVALRPVTWLLFKDVWDGAQTSLYCACAEELRSHTGKYYAGCKESSPFFDVYNDDVARQLWDVSLKLTNLSPDDVCLTKRDHL